MPKTPERIDLGPGLSISRLVCGLWQVADLEKDRHGARPRTRRRCPRRLCPGRLRQLRHGRPLRQRRADRRPAAGAPRQGCRAAARLHQMVPGARADDRRGGPPRRPGPARPAGRRPGRPAAVPLVDLRASGLARRAARDGAAAGGGADRRDRRHQFRRRASGRGAGRRRAGPDQPGLVLPGRPPRRRRACPSCAGPRA